MRHLVGHWLLKKATKLIRLQRVLIGSFLSIAKVGGLKCRKVADAAWPPVRNCVISNYYRDYDPAAGKYWESDPLGVNTYAYVRDNPEAYNDPTGLRDSGWECDGHDNAVPVVMDTNPCTRECTKAHEESHIADAKRRWGL
ncbi:MAG: hypothetical protein JSR66_34070 [Proteobacteria bacterium]|nr:hypothetical protein [Pseudomonadota bacterium]